MVGRFLDPASCGLGGASIVQLPDERLREPIGRTPGIFVPALLLQIVFLIETSQCCLDTLPVIAKRAQRVVERTEALVKEVAFRKRHHARRRCKKALYESGTRTRASDQENPSHCRFCPTITLKPHGCDQPGHLTAVGPTPRFGQSAASSIDP